MADWKPTITPVEDGAPMTPASVNTPIGEVQGNAQYLKDRLDAIQQYVGRVSDTGSFSVHPEPGNAEWVVANPSTGHYVVTHKKGSSHWLPVIQPFYTHGGSSKRTAMLEDVSADSFTVLITNLGGDAVNEDFVFVMLKAPPAE